MDRRGFIKLVSLLPIATPWIARSTPHSPRKLTEPNRPNVLILVFDALSSLDVSLYGYHRETMPNLTRFAKKATVFLNHYSAGNYTVPGTASILTGTYPWTHRAFLHNSTILDSFTPRNVFGLLKQAKYTSIGFSHNLMVSILLDHLKDRLDEFILPNDIALVDFNISDNLFEKDFNLSAQAERRYLKKTNETSNSLFLSPLLWSVRQLSTRLIKSRLQRQFPRGIPGFHDMLYPLEDTIDWITRQLSAWSQPFAAYLHMMPPHDPYNPRKEFANLFYDGWEPITKPDHFFSVKGRRPQKFLNEQRVHYDQYIAYVDAEFGRLYDYLGKHGFLDNTVVVFTSDHGEMFERRIFKHTTPTVFQPIIRVPLLISTPGQSSRLDVIESTSCVDILPTLLHLTGQSIPDWIEGEVLPPYTGRESDPQRSIFVVEAKSNPKMNPLRKATVAMIKGNYKLIYYFGYEGFDGVFELYDLKKDPEELENLYDSHRSIASELESELITKIREKNEPYLHS